MADKTTFELKEEAKQMAKAQNARGITLESLRQRFKCTGGEVFNILQGTVLEGDLRDKLFGFLCTAPPAPVVKVEPPPPPAPPKPAEPVDLISKPSARGKAPRPPVGEPYQPPKPDPVPPVEIVPHDEQPARPLQRIIGTPESIHPLPGQAPSGEWIGDAGDRLDATLNARGLPADAGASLVTDGIKALLSSSQKVEPPVYRLPVVGEKSSAEVGKRLRAAMKEKNFTCETLAPFFGHKTGSNISASLSKSGSRRFQIRLCQFFGLNGEGLAVPGWTEKQEIPTPGTVPVALAPQLPDERVQGTAARAAAANAVPGHVVRSARLPAVPRAGDAVSPTLLSDAQTGALLELARTADELNRTNRERNHAITRYKNALAAAEAAGVRFATV